MNINSDLLTVEEAADFLRISVYKLEQCYRGYELAYINDWHKGLIYFR